MNFFKEVLIVAPFSGKIARKISLSRQWQSRADDKSKRKIGKAEFLPENFKLRNCRDNTLAVLIPFIEIYLHEILYLATQIQCPEATNWEDSVRGVTRLNRF